MGTHVTSCIGEVLANNLSTHLSWQEVNIINILEVESENGVYSSVRCPGGVDMRNLKIVNFASQRHLVHLDLNVESFSQVSRYKVKKPVSAFD